MSNLDQSDDSLSLESLCHHFPDLESGFRIRELGWFEFKQDPDDPSRLAWNRMDPLIKECNDRIGGFEGKELLELGPFEGCHSVNLAHYQPAEVTSIEANPYNYIKCLIVKQYFQLTNTDFLLGNFVSYLAECNRKFDFILASGVLYHLNQPLLALDLILQNTDAIGICTTVFAEGDSPFNMTGETRTVEKAGHKFELHERKNAVSTQGKKHGIDKSAWMISQPDLLKYLEVSGWEFELLPYKRQPHCGPRTRLFARRSK